MNFPFDCAREFILRNFEIVGGLQIQPETGAGVEVSSQPQRRIRSYTAPLVDNFGNSRYRDAEIESQPVHAELERFHELGAENLARMDWR